jgi:hypothetical protein
MQRGALSPFGDEKDWLSARTVSDEDPPVAINSPVPEYADVERP